MPSRKSITIHNFYGDKSVVEPEEIEFPRDPKNPKIRRVMVNGRIIQIFRTEDAPEEFFKALKEAIAEYERPKKAPRRKRKLDA